MCGDEGADARDARGDEQDVGYGAHRHHGEHMLTADALAQHKGVLRADRDDQRQRGEEADDQR
jgi:hypothetical protein